jgi:hypothetical protein
MATYAEPMGLGILNSLELNAYFFQDTPPHASQRTNITRRCQASNTLRVCMQPHTEMHWTENFSLATSSSMQEI